MVVTTASNTLGKQPSLYSTTETNSVVFCKLSYAPWFSRLKIEFGSESELAQVLGLLSFTGSSHHGYHITGSRLGIE